VCDLKKNDFTKPTKHRKCVKFQKIRTLGGKNFSQKKCFILSPKKQQKIRFLSCDSIAQMPTEHFHVQNILKMWGVAKINKRSVEKLS